MISDQERYPKKKANVLGYTTMDFYRRPFLNPGEDRRPALSWPRQIPIEGQPQKVVEIVTTYARWLAQSDIPKLFINAEPGSILVGRTRDFCRTWPNQEEVTFKGRHFIQEDSPEEIGHAIANFIHKINQRRKPQWQRLIFLMKFSHLFRLRRRRF